MTLLYKNHTPQPLPCGWGALRGGEWRDWFIPFFHLQKQTPDFRNVVEAGLRRRLMDCMCVCLGERSREWRKSEMSPFHTRYFHTRLFLSPSQAMTGLPSGQSHHYSPQFPARYQAPKNDVHTITQGRWQGQTGSLFVTWSTVHCPFYHTPNLWGSLSARPLLASTSSQLRTFCFQPSWPECWWMRSTTPGGSINPEERHVPMFLTSAS